MTDHELLHEYTTRHSETAFTEIVQRHGGMVYASAMRQLGNPHQAEEVTQAVFILLARKASSLKPSVLIGGWLFRTAQFAVNDLRKSEFRRQRRETFVYEMNTEPNPGYADSTPNNASWEQVAPVLDQCLGHLGEMDRHAILLRFFENKSLAEVGAALGIAEDAARKRVRRALDKLEQLLVKEGACLTQNSLPPILQSGNLIAAAPVGMLAKAAATALHSLPGTTSASATLSATLSTTSSASTLAGNVGKQLSWIQWKQWAAVGTAAILTTSTAAWSWQALRPEPTSVVAKATDNYLTAGFPDAPVVHSFIQDLQGLVLAKDRAAIASKIHYPLRVNTRSGSFLIESPAQLLASFDRVFPASVLRVLLKCPRSGLYCDKRGVMIGSGEIWLAPKAGEVVALSNNKDPVQPEIIAVNLP